MKRIYLSSLLYLPILVIGFIMLFFPKVIIDLFNIMISLIFIFNGIKYLLDEYFFRSSNSSFNPLVMGIINISIGLLILLTDVSLVNILPNIIAFFCMVYSISMLFQILRTKDLGNVSSINKITAGSLAFIVGLLLFANADLTSEILVRLLGIIIIVIIFNINLGIYTISKKIPSVKRIKKK